MQHCSMPQLPVLLPMSAAQQSGQQDPYLAAPQALQQQAAELAEQQCVLQGGKPADSFEVLQNVGLQLQLAAQLAAQEAGQQATHLAAPQAALGPRQETLRGGLLQWWCAGDPTLMMSFDHVAASFQMHNAACHPNPDLFAH